MSWIWLVIWKPGLHQRVHRSSFQAPPHGAWRSASKELTSEHRARKWGEASCLTALADVWDDLDIEKETETHQEIFLTTWDENVWWAYWYARNAGVDGAVMEKHSRQICVIDAFLLCGGFPSYLTLLPTQAVILLHTITILSSVKGGDGFLIQLVKARCYKLSDSWLGWQSIAAKTLLLDLSDYCTWRDIPSFLLPCQKEWYIEANSSDG